MRWGVILLTELMLTRCAVYDNGYYGYPYYYDFDRGYPYYGHDHEFREYHEVVNTAGSANIKKRVNITTMGTRTPVVKRGDGLSSANALCDSSQRHVGGLRHNIAGLVYYRPVIRLKILRNRQ